MTAAAPPHHRLGAHGVGQAERRRTRRPLLHAGAAFWFATLTGGGHAAIAAGPLPVPLADGAMTPAAGSSLSLTQSAQVNTAGSIPVYAVDATGKVASVTTNAARTLIDWKSYQVDQGYTLNYVVTNASDIVLNRVPSGSSIDISGTITSKLSSGGSPIAGNLWFLGPSGVFFHDGASVSAGGILATTGSLGAAGFLTDANFLDPTNFAFTLSGATGLVQVGGLIGTGTGATLGAPVSLTTNGGSLVLVSKTVSSASNATVGSANYAVAGARSSDTASTLYGAATDYTLTFVDHGYSGLDLFSFSISAGSDATDALNLQGVTQTGRVYLAAVNTGAALNRLINLGGAVVATNATLSGDAIVLSAGSGLTTDSLSHIVPNAASGASATAALNADMTTSSTGTVTLSATGILNFVSGTLTAGALSATGQAGIQFNGGSISTTGAQTYSGASTLGVDTTDRKSVV